MNALYTVLYSQNDFSSNLLQMKQTAYCFQDVINMVTFAIRIGSRQDIKMGAKIFLLYIGIMLLMCECHKTFMMLCKISHRVELVSAKV